MNALPDTLILQQFYTEGHAADKEIIILVTPNLLSIGVIRAPHRSLMWDVILISLGN